MTKNRDYEARKQRRLHALGTDDPRCVCGENRWECMELHHVEGQAYGNTLVVICRNCHRVLSVAQEGHPVSRSRTDRDITQMARLLTGFADLLELVVAKLRETASALQLHCHTLAGGTT